MCDINDQFGQAGWEDNNEVIVGLFIENIFINTKARKFVYIFYDSVGNQICLLQYTKLISLDLSRALQELIYYLSRTKHIIECSDFVGCNQLFLVMVNANFLIANGCLVLGGYRKGRVDCVCVQDVGTKADNFVSVWSVCLKAGSFISLSCLAREISGNCLMQICV